MVLPDFTIHRCRLRVVRRGGWRWGMGRRALTELVVRSLADVLQRSLAQAVPPDSGDVEIRDRIEVRVPLTQTDLLALGPQRRDPSGPAAGQYPPSSPGPLDGSPPRQRLEKALRDALQSSLSGGRAGSAAQTAKPEETQVPQTAEQPASAHGQLLRLLLGWRRSGELGVYLRSLPEHVLRIWHDLLLPAARSDTEADGAEATGPSPGRVQSPSASTDEAGMDNEAGEGPGGSFPKPGVPEAPDTADLARHVVEIVQRIAAMPRPDAAGLAGRLLVRLVAAVEVADQLALALPDPRVRRALEHVLPLPAGANASLTARAGKQSDRQFAAASRGGPSVKTPAPQRAGDVYVRSALPFLLLGPLQKTGYFDALAAAFQAAGRSDQLPVFAAALAYKVLPPPDRGWRRNASETAAAAAVAGLDAPVSGSLLTRLASHADEVLWPPTAVLTRAVLRGHPVDQPLLVHAVESGAGGGLLLLDVQGTFPAAWADHHAALITGLMQCETSLLLIPGRASSESLLKALDAAGLRFVTEAAPIRGEHWRAVRRGSAGQWWTNDTASRSGRLTRHALGMGDADGAAARLCRALQMDRLAAPLADDPLLDRGLTLAAGVALGQIAWTLWRDRETTDPLLALERFADLDAHVRFGSGRVHVQLPLGRRSLDLAERGLLGDVAGVPWLGGRVVTFGKG